MWKPKINNLGWKKNDKTHANIIDFLFINWCFLIYLFET